ncbi:MAG: CDP-diacylglycerol--serine O-phosphatidyltransferase [Desulfobulbaceae bacterium BRH_c16a]|nr:MAG: CDP-diacylglycerol--serine O-phosphatidyltransferase [Desulfobulbaceae bacterium BRH_c16a]
MAAEHTEMSSKFYPLPCMFTIASLFCGFYSILAAIKGDFVIAAVAILVAAVFDGIDGRVARFTGTTSTFGMELDSLCDLVSFGVAPALLAYFWTLQPYGRYGWLAAFLYVATTALRLARFNSQHSSATHHFVGLPCPAAAGMISAVVLFAGYLGLDGSYTHMSLLFLVYVLAYLMVSTHPFYSFKKPPRLTRTKTFQLLVASVLIFVLIAAEPQIMMFVVFLLYIASGPFFALVKKIRPAASQAGEKRKNAI